ncbi:hypothetical protein [uncultured Campylobacter sp.]|uniref:hypothetical protein n=1 Tax=uncultured Campylobacter sp. TaxID=218934 RepID=UPI00262BE8A1|nr:hypothetical protein [uncultured Campylobacter sp.]
MFDKDFKAKVRLFYETHDIGIKELSKEFDLQYRTVLNWVKKEKWQRAKGLKDILQSDIKKELVKKEFGTVIDATSNKIKEKIANNLGESLYDVSEIVRKNTLDSVSDELLLKAMGISFLQKNMALGALIAKDELLRMIELRQANRSDPVIIACAEKFVSILQDLQKSFYSEKESYLKLNSLNDESLEFEKLSESEILELLAKEKDK